MKPIWIKLRRKSGGYRTRDGRFVLSPIIAPSGNGCPKYVMFEKKGKQTVRELGSHHSLKTAARYLRVSLKEVV